MEEAVVNRQSRRHQVHKLFSDPEGTSELWSEIQSPERGLDPGDWCNLAFDAAHCGQLSLLQWLIYSKKIPILIRNRKGCNLLHAAASFGQESVTEWLLNQQENYSASVVLFCGRSKRKRTPLEIAVRSNHFGMINCMLELEVSYSFHSTSETFDVIEQCCQIAEPAMKEYLVGRLRTMEIKMFFFDLTMHSEQNMHEILPKLAEYSWYKNRRDIEWNEHEKFVFYIALVAASRRWDKVLIKWLLDEWNVSLKPPSLYQWKGLSCADVVAMGKHVDEEILESLGSSDDYQYYSKHFFDMMVCGRWEDGQCSSLIASIEPLIYKDGETLDFRNKWFEALCEKDFECRLEVLQAFAEKYEDQGAESFALPRLDLVISCGQLHILKWLIDSGFVNMNFPLSSTEEMSVVKEEDDDDGAFNDAVCAICHSIKRFPVELQCGHSYCHSCIRQVHAYSHANMQGFQCPYCRRHLSVPPSMTISTSLQYHLKAKSPWLQYQPSNTIGEVLMALAAGSGSVFILEYLISQHHLDPVTTLYANGRNLMHLAASRPNVVCCKWLCLNGYVDLATSLSDENLSPVHEAINNSNYAASFAFELFLDHNVVPDNWIDLAVVSPNAGIVNTAECTVSHKSTAAISKLLAANAPLDQLIGIIDKSSFGKCHIFDDNVINSLFEFIIRCGRVDVLIWLYTNDVRRQTVYFGEKRREFIRVKIGQLDSNRRVMEAFMDDLEAAEKLGHEIAKCNSGFNQMIVDGAPVVTIEAVIERQEELIKRIQNLNLKREYLQISFDRIVRHGLNPLEMAAHCGYVHLIDWILKRSHANINEALSQVFSQAIPDGNIVVFKFTLSWLDDNNQTLPKSLEIHGTNSSLLDTVVSSFASSASFMSSDDDGKIWKGCFEMAQILVYRPGIDVNALNKQRQTALFHLARVVLYQRDNQNTANFAEIIADQTFKLIQMLVNAGTDLHHVDANNKTFFEVVLKEASPLLMRSIRWLALEKGMDIQFVQFSCFNFDRNVRERVDAEFKAIREEQRQLQLQKR